MKYVPPLGGGANDPYVDGDPQTGTKGSIVPAAAIEDTQREIVNAIIAAGLTPDDQNLTQLTAAIQALAGTGSPAAAAGTHTALHASIASNDRAVYPIIGFANWPPAIYDATADKTYLAWEAVNPRNTSVARIKAFDHAAGDWDPTIYDIDYWYDLDDAHGQPALCLDPDEYLLSFYGAHASDVLWAISKNPNDPSSWNIQTPLASANDGFTYPKPVRVGAKVHLLLRETIAASTKMTIVHMSGTPSGGTLLFGSVTTLVDLGTDSRAYVSEVMLSGTDLHFTVVRANYGDTRRENVYYFVFDTVTENMKSIDGGTVVLNANLPVDLATANASFRVVNSGSNRTNNASLQLDTNGDPHILYPEGGGDQGFYFLKHQMWDGANWSTPEVIAQILDHDPDIGVVDYGALVPGANGEMQAYFLQNVVSGQRGGDVVRRVRASGGGWGAAETLVPKGRRAHAGVAAVFGAHGSFRVVFSEIGANTDYNNSQTSLKLYGHGDNGFIKPPGTYAYQHLEDGDEVVIVGVNPNSGNIDDLTGRFAEGTGVPGALTLNGDVAASSGKMSFDGTGDYVEISDSQAWLFNGDFTIECRNVNFDLLSGTRTLVAQWDTGNKNFLFDYNATSGELRFLISLTGDGVGNNTYAESVALSDGVDYVLTIERKDGVLRFYVDGSQIGADHNEGGTSFDSTASLTIGANFSSGAAANFFDGTIEKVLITKKALYAE